MKRLSLIAVAVMVAVSTSGRGSMNNAISDVSVAQNETGRGVELQVDEVSGSERQLADEITRRLRRMGFNMIRNRLARPAEMAGVIC